MKFRVILEHNSVEGKFIFTNIADCNDSWDCVDYCNRWYPDYHVEQLTQYN